MGDGLWRRVVGMGCGDGLWETGCGDGLWGRVVGTGCGGWVVGMGCGGQVEIASWYWWSGVVTYSLLRADFLFSSLNSRI